MVHFDGALKPWQLKYDLQDEKLYIKLNGQIDTQRDFFLSWWRIMHQHAWLIIQPEMSTGPTFLSCPALCPALGSPCPAVQEQYQKILRAALSCPALQKQYQKILRPALSCPALQDRAGQGRVSLVFLFNGFLQLQREQYILHIFMSEHVFYLSLVALHQDEIDYSHKESDKHRFK